ncbi:MAG: hypothetical protein ACAI35_28060 [Candidatus Methylacidiphilales bacterium]|nr:hypothetical protein [Candidatus Methylacidiphilales bacterium]
MSELKYNTSLDFLGLDVLKAKQAATLADFEKWAAASRWSEIHSHHYDWWMFPIPRPSMHGNKFTVYSGEIEQLKADAAYMKNYLRGHELLSLAWGWDLYKAAFIPQESAGPGQKWSDWPIRLNKAAHSAREFGQREVLRSHCVHARILIDRGEYFWFHDLDIARWFRKNGA